jgi:hypothetical protein
MQHRQFSAALPQVTSNSWAASISLGVIVPPRGAASLMRSTTMSVNS